MADSEQEFLTLEIMMKFPHSLNDCEEFFFGGKIISL